MTFAPIRKKIIIMGAGGRDFHNFNVLYRENPEFEVVAFTATQIPDISGRIYPRKLAGPHYPDGIPIEDETKFESLCKRFEVDQVIFAYSDVQHESVMHIASQTLAAGADFVLLGPKSTMLASNKPVISVTAVRTGCGKSQTCRWIFARLRAYGIRVGVLRHPMPYGDLERQRVQRFASFDDLDAADCTNEEREEYEPYIEAGGVVFAGVDYQAILELAEKEANVILWDGGNNDFSFIRPDLNIVLVDALRPDQVTSHHPGEASIRMADAVVVNKVHAARPADVDRVIAHVTQINSGVPIIRAASPIRIAGLDSLRGRRVLVVEDGPTITHGGLAHGAGYIAAQKFEAAEIIDPRTSATSEIKDIYRLYPHIGQVLPAVGYSEHQLKALRQTIETSSADIVLIATPFDLSKHLELTKKSVRVYYDYADAGKPTLGSIIDEFVEQRDIKRR